MPNYNETSNQKITFKDLMDKTQVEYIAEYGQNIDTWALHQAMERILQDLYQGDTTPYLVGQSRLIAYDTIIDPSTLYGEELLALVHDHLEQIHMEAKRIALTNKSKASTDMLAMRVSVQMLHGQDFDTIMNDGVNKWTHEAQKIQANLTTPHEAGWSGKYKLNLNQ
jgi:hypothetical protein